MENAINKNAVTLAKDIITATALLETLKDKHEIMFKNWLSKNNLKEETFFLFPEADLEAMGIEKINKDLVKCNEVRTLLWKLEDEAITFMMKQVNKEELSEKMKGIVKFRKKTVETFLSYYTQFFK